jgi:hypothetical protein
MMAEEASPNNHQACFLDVLDIGIKLIMRCEYCKTTLLLNKSTLLRLNYGNNKRVAAISWCITNTSPLTLKLASRAGSDSDVFLKRMMCDHRSEPPLWSGGCGCQCQDDGHAEVRDRARRRTATAEARDRVRWGRNTGFDTNGFTRFLTQYYWVTSGFG